MDQIRTASTIDVHAWSANPKKYADPHNSGQKDDPGQKEGKPLYQPLHLACLTWPEYPALAGHSDGDAAAHALADALLQAAGVGEMGSVFGVDRPEFANARGSVFLQEAARLVHEAGWQVASAQVQLICQEPRFAPRRSEAEEAMSSALGVNVIVSATTTDHLGFIGHDEGVAALASALVTRRTLLQRGLGYLGDMLF
ncbi:MAG: 2-C-methyl-D-erythritol 2,4-cyclodiphosphate synthase [Actinomycetaceae bacterium]|nr:2-C-methyl-D-erythritol 2,4-cyclodiphosphate synthase [Actinomycetaceae bacterium]MDY6082480.1 2-C-methyl-D-erythritol 2,4-cyclodiphosphate synthase [Actinomycetaceae bacterium]